MFRFFARLFGSAPDHREADQPTPEHAVLVRFEYGSTDLQPIFDLSTELEQTIDAAGVGEFDGNAVASDGSDGTLYMYGPNADELFEIVLPVLSVSEFLKGAEVTLRYGPAEDGVEEKMVIIGA